MKKIVFLLILPFFFASVNAFALQSCSDISVDPEISFSTSYGKLVYDFSKNTRQISAIAKKIGKQESETFATGLATVSVDNEYIVGTIAYPLQKGGYCVFPQKIEVFVGFADPMIYISRELKKNSCHYNLVMLHEQTHQRINIAALDYFIPYFQKAAEKISKKILPLQVENQQQIDVVTNQMTQDFTDRFDKVLDIFKKELAVEQGKLDNKINYSLEDDLCKNFNAKHLRR